jgi:hypothetical protein
MMIKPEATAVGRLLKPKGNEPRIYKVIAVKPDGSSKTVISEPA